MSDPPRDDHRVEALRPLFRTRGVALTPQRRAILRAVLDSDEHPTADRVHSALRRRRLRVSRATVFRTLEAFARLGVITKACHPGMAVRYDGRTRTHHHLVCTRCDRIADFTDSSLDALPAPDTRPQGFLVTEKLSVLVRGVCRQCREQEEKKR